MGASAAPVDGLLAEERGAVVAYARRMVRDRLVVGTSATSPFARPTWWR